MTNKRKERARKIAERQEYEEKRHRLLNVLVQKLMLKYGPQTEKSLPKSQISDIVDSYLEKIPSIVNVTNIRNVKDLELELSTEIQSVQRRQVKVKFASDECNVIDKVESRKSSGDALIHLTQTASKEQQEETNMKSKREINPWAMIETFQIVENEESNEEKKIKALQKKKDMALSLHDQIRMKQNAAKEEKAEDTKFLDFQRRAIKEWEEEQVLNEKVAHKKISELKKVRQQQVEETKRKKEAELSKKMSSELREIEEIKLALQTEEERKHQKKQLEREKWGRIEAENSQKLEVRRLAKEEEARMDAKLMENMRVEYENKEKRRAQQKEEKRTKLKLNGQRLIQVGACSKREEKLKFEKTLLEAAAARERALTLREKKKHEMERKKQDQITETNKQMAEERRRREKEIEKENEAYALKCLKEKEALLDEEEAKRIKQHETKEKYRRVLQEQMDEQKKTKTDFDGMTIVERSINKKMMKKIEKSNVKKKILDKVASYDKVPNPDEINVG